MKSRIVNGHYMFGNTFIQPEMPMYNNIRHHYMAGAPRKIPPYPDMDSRPVHCPDGDDAGCCYAYEDCANKLDCPYISADSDGRYAVDCSDCELCKDNIFRSEYAASVINIETQVVKILKVKIYNIDPAKDKTVDMVVGNKYAVTYITEHGLITSTGYLEMVSESVPDACTRYINSDIQSAVSTAYIGMDCSTDGHSNKRKIYIATIRNVELVSDEQTSDETVEGKTIKVRLQELLDSIDAGEIVIGNGDIKVVVIDDAENEEPDPKEPETEDLDNGLDDEL